MIHFCWATKSFLKSWVWVSFYTTVWLKTTALFACETVRPWEWQGWATGQGLCELGQDSWIPYFRFFKYPLLLRDKLYCQIVSVQEDCFTGKLKAETICLVTLPTSIFLIWPIKNRRFVIDASSTLFFYGSSSGQGLWRCPSPATCPINHYYPCFIIAITVLKDCLIRPSRTKLFS
jgi:hypothetical protein